MGFTIFNPVSALKSFNKEISVVDMSSQNSNFNNLLF